MRGIWFLVATLAVGELAYVAADRWRPVTGGATGLTAEPLMLAGGATLTLDGHRYLYVFAWFAVFVGAVVWLLTTRFGLVLRGLAANEVRLHADGYAATLWLWSAYVVAGAVAAAGGALMVAGRGYVAPSDLGYVVSALALLAAITGLRHPIWACLAAIGIIAVRDIGGNLLTGRGPLMLGAAFVAAAIFLARRRGHGSAQVNP